MTKSFVVCSINGQLKPIGISSYRFHFKPGHSRGRIGCTANGSDGPSTATTATTTTTATIIACHILRAFDGGVNPRRPTIWLRNFGGFDRSHKAASIRGVFLYGYGLWSFRIDYFAVVLRSQPDHRKDLLGKTSIERSVLVNFCCRTGTIVYTETSHICNMC